MVVRRLEYFGFVLERETEPLRGRWPDDLAPAARSALVAALLAGETPHPDQGRVRKALERFGQYWRRSGGQLAAAAGDRVAQILAGQMAGGRARGDFLPAPPSPGGGHPVPAGSP